MGRVVPAILDKARRSNSGAACGSSSRGIDRSHLFPLAHEIVRGVCFGYWSREGVGGYSTCENKSTRKNNSFFSLRRTLFLEKIKTSGGNLLTLRVLSGLSCFSSAPVKEAIVRYFHYRIVPRVEYFHLESIELHRGGQCLSLSVRGCLSRLRSSEPDFPRDELKKALRSLFSTHPRFKLIESHRGDRFV